MIDVLRRDGRAWRVGHRGAAALAPENTLPSFARALEEGVDFVEFDVLALADGALVLAHSDDLRELTHGRASGRVGGRSLAELRRVAPQLPTLDEALAYLAAEAPGVGLHVDLKAVGYEARVVDALRRHGAVERALVSSFFAGSLATVGTLEPKLRLGVSYPLDRRGLSAWRPLAPAVLATAAALRRVLPHRIEGLLDRAGATVATLHYLVVSRSVIDRCHRRGAAVFVWTVDDARLLARLVAAGADGIITNDPRIFRAATLSA